MINYRVENIGKILEEMKMNHIIVLDTIETFEYGKFVHVLDEESNKLELWQPDDIEFESMGTELGLKTTKSYIP